MKVVSGAMGKEKVHYEAVATEKVKPEMDWFLNCLKNALPASEKKSA